ncbi:MAG: hypothetical protein R2794_06600 [Chitinophagales bacterium]
MKNYLFVFLVCITSVSRTQVITQGIKGVGYIYKDRPVMVQASDVQEFDDELMEIYKTYWPYSQATLQYDEDWKASGMDSAYNYFGTYTIVDKIYNNVLGQTTQREFYAYLAGTSGIHDPSYSSIFTYMPLNVGMPDLYADADYQLLTIKYFLASTVGVIEFVGKNKMNVHGASTSVRKAMNKYNAENAYKVKDKTLLVLENYLYPVGGSKKSYITEEDLKKYPFPYKVVSLDEFIAIDKTNDPAYCFMDFIANDTGYMFIFDVANKRALFLEGLGYPGKYYTSWFFTHLRSKVEEHK